MKRVIYFALAAAISIPARGDILEFDYDFLDIIGFSFGSPISEDDVTSFSNTGNFSGGTFDVDGTISGDFLTVVFSNFSPSLMGSGFGPSFTLDFSNLDFGTENLVDIEYDDSPASAAAEPAGFAGANDVVLNFSAPGLNNGDGNEVTYRFEFITDAPTAVPEPSSFAVCFIGGLAAWRIRRKRAA